MSAAARRRAVVWWIGAHLDHFATSISSIGRRLEDSAQQCTVCREWPDTGRHQPAELCPGLDDGSGCNGSAEHHAWRGPWWTR